MKTEFTTFRVKKGREDRAVAWMEMLQDRKKECVATLSREKMGYESVFKMVIGERLYLSWFSVQGEAAESVDDSEHEVDVLHCQFWEECIDQKFSPQNHEHVVTFCDPNVEKEIARITGKRLRQILPPK